jgi:hypothetical protein
LPASSYLNAAMASGWITPDGAEIPDNADNADIAILLRATAASHSLDFWAMGDVINWVRVHKFEGRLPKEETEKIAALTGVAYKTAINRAAVAAAFPKGKRLSEVPSGVHAVIAGVEDENLRYALLAEAAANQWTVITATEKVKDFIAMGATADAEGVITTPDIAVLAPDGSTVVNTNVSTSSTGLAVNIDACIATMVTDMAAGGFTADNIAGVLKMYAAGGLLKFPPRAWLIKDDMSHAATTEPVVKSNGKKTAHVATEVAFADSDGEDATEVAFA